MISKVLAGHLGFLSFSGGGYGTLCFCGYSLSVGGEFVSDENGIQGAYISFNSQRKEVENLLRVDVGGWLEYVPSSQQSTNGEKMIEVPVIESTGRRTNKEMKIRFLNSEDTLQKPLYTEVTETIQPALPRDWSEVELDYVSGVPRKFVELRPKAEMLIVEPKEQNSRVEIVFTTETKIMKPLLERSVEHHVYEVPINDVLKPSAKMIIGSVSSVSNSSFGESPEIQQISSKPTGSVASSDGSREMVFV